MIDDSDDPSRAGTPKPTAPEKDVESKENGTQEGAEAADSSKDGPTKKLTTEEKTTTAPAAKTNPPSEVKSEPDIKQRLKKLEKLEATYPGMSIPFRYGCITTAFLQ